LDVIELALEEDNFRLATLASQALYNLSKSMEHQSTVQKRILAITNKEIPESVKDILIRVVE
jgi:hypothetical protein